MNHKAKFITIILVFSFFTQAYAFEWIAPDEASNSDELASLPFSIAPNADGGISVETEDTVQNIPRPDPGTEIQIGTTLRDGSSLTVTMIINDDNGTVQYTGMLLNQDSNILTVVTVDIATTSLEGTFLVGITKTIDGQEVLKDWELVDSGIFTNLIINNSDDSGSTGSPGDIGSGGGGNGDLGGGIWGDPHYIDLTNPSKNSLARDFDVMGEAGKVFNILSDQHIQVNNLYTSTKEPGKTMVGAVGVKLLDDVGKIHQIQFANRSEPMLDGKKVKPSEINTFPMQGKKATVAYDGHCFKIETSEYKLSFIAQKDNSLDERIQVQPTGVLTDNVPPHGLLGQTADGDTHIRHGKTGAGAQGEGAIDYNYRKYQVADLFSDPDADINRFQLITSVNFDKGKVSQIANAKTGKLLASSTQDGQLVSVRYQTNADGSERVTLADGKTPVDQFGEAKSTESSKKGLARLKDAFLLVMR